MRALLKRSAKPAPQISEHNSRQLLPPPLPPDQGHQKEERPSNLPPAAAPKRLSINRTCQVKHIMHVGGLEGTDDVLVLLWGGPMGLSELRGDSEVLQHD